MGQAKEFMSKVKPDWCPGCGDFGVLASLYNSLAGLKIDPKDLVMVSGIGCSGRTPGFVDAPGIP